MQCFVDHRAAAHRVLPVEPAAGVDHGLGEVEHFVALQVLPVGGDDEGRHFDLRITRLRHVVDDGVQVFAREAFAGDLAMQRRQRRRWLGRQHLRRMAGGDAQAREGVFRQAELVRQHDGGVIDDVEHGVDGHAVGAHRHLGQGLEAGGAHDGAFAVQVGHAFAPGVDGDTTDAQFLRGHGFTLRRACRRHGACGARLTMVNTAGRHWPMLHLPTPHARRRGKLSMNEIKTLLWHLDTESAEGRKLPWVRDFASKLGARAEVLYAVTPLPMQFPFAMSAESSAAGQFAACEAEMRQAAQAAFRRACTTAGCTELAWQESLDEPVRAFTRAAWAADLLVLNQRDPKAETPAGVPADFVASVLLGTGKPGLVLPYIETAPCIAQTVLVAWKATRESARALDAALPLLLRAGQVHVVGWNEHEAADTDPLAPALQFLQRHGVVATAHPQQGRPPRELGEALLSLAADLQADLLVMGCYGHGRAREWALGGVTRTVLQTMTLPVLMVH